jgi:hypothetical protein
LRHEIIQAIVQRGEVTEQWYRERDNVFKELVSDEAREATLRRTSRYTWLAPLEFHLQRIVRDRAGVVA